MSYPADDWDETPGKMRLAPGRWIDPANPDPADIHIGDIAHGLANLCRFGGHVATRYTVAEHSLYVAGQLWRTHGDHQLALCGLMHDATEAYLGDVIRPVKRHLPEYHAMEDRMARAIAGRFGLPTDDLALWAEVKRADEEILAWEMVMFRDCDWRPPADPAAVAKAFERKFRWHSTGGVTTQFAAGGLHAEKLASWFVGRAR